MAYRIAPSDVVAASTVHGSGNGSTCPSLLTWQHRDSSKPQNLFCSRHYWSCVQLLILEDLQWLGWGLCAERVPSMLRSALRVLFVHELRLQWSEKTSRLSHSSFIRVVNVLALRKLRSGATACNTVCNTGPISSIQVAAALPLLIHTIPARPPVDSL